MARGQLAGDEHVGAARAARRDREEVDRGGARSTSRRSCRSTPRSRSSARSSITEATAAWKALRPLPGLAQRPYEAALVHFNYGLAAVRLDAELGRGAPRADREPAQARAGRRRLRAGRRARARVRLLPDPAQARQGERRSSRTSPRATSTASACCATTTSSSTSCSTTRTSSSSRSSAASSTPRRRCTRRPPRSRRAPACRTTATTSTRAR